jgi:hypothetical protein
VMSQPTPIMFIADSQRFGLFNVIAQKCFALITTSAQFNILAK